MGLFGLKPIMKPLLQGSICYVYGLSAPKEVQRVYATRIVATMTSNIAFA